MCYISATQKEGDIMRKYRLVIRCQVYMGWLISDRDLIAMECLYITPAFYADSNLEYVEIVEEAYELFCAGRHEFRHTESVEVVPAT